MPRSALIYYLRFEVEGYTCNKVNDNNDNTKVMPM